MPLPSNWWTTGATNFRDVRLAPSVSGASSSITSLVSGGVTYYTSVVSGITGRIACLGGVGTNDDQELYGTREYGYFYAQDAGSNYGKFEHIHMRSSASPYGDQNGLVYWNHDDTPQINAVVSGSGTSLYNLHMWMPTTFFGTVAEVLAASLLYASVVSGRADLDGEDFDQDSFDASYDAQQTYGSGGSNTIYVLYRREPGQSFADMAKALARHSWDILTINMAGKLALVSRQSPGASYQVSSLNSDDGVVSVRLRYAYEHLANIVYAGYGRWHVKRREEKPEDGGGGTAYVYTSISEPTVPSRIATESSPWAEYVDTTSQGRYDDRRAANSQVTVYADLKDESRRAFHLPYLTQETPSLNATPAATARDNYMDRLDKDAQLRREITVVQDMRGVDYDVGYTVADVAVTRDGETIDDMRCIKKTLDFNDFTVTSTLLEEPS